MFSRFGLYSPNVLPGENLELPTMIYFPFFAAYKQILFLLYYCRLHTLTPQVALKLPAS